MCGGVDEQVRVTAVGLTWRLRVADAEGSAVRQSGSGWTQIEQVYALGHKGCTCVTAHDPRGRRYLTAAWLVPLVMCCRGKVGRCGCCSQYHTIPTCWRAQLEAQPLPRRGPSLNL